MIQVIVALLMGLQAVFGVAAHEANKSSVKEPYHATCENDQGQDPECQVAR